MKALPYIILALLFTGCSAEKRITRIAANHPGSLAKPCSIMYPPMVLRDSTVTRYLPGKEIPGPTRFVTVDCDSAVNAMGGAQTGTGTVRRVFVNVPCPPSYTRVDTVDSQRFRVEQSTAALDTMKRALSKAEADVAKYKDEAEDNKERGNVWRKRAFWGWGILAAVTVLAVVRLFLKLKRVV